MIVRAPLGFVVAGLLAGLLAGLAACGSNAEERLFQPHIGVDDFEYASLQEMSDDSGVAVVVRIDGFSETIRTGAGDPLIDTDLYDAAIVERLVGADDLPDSIRLASVLLEDGPDGPSAPPHRVDAEVWRDDREFLLFLQPFRFRLEIWPDTHAFAGGMPGIFEREVGSQDAFRSIVPSELAIADEVSVADVEGLTPGGRPPDPDEY